MPSLASAQQTPATLEAQARFDEAVRALEDHRFGDAIGLLEAVNRARPTPAVQVNLGYAYRGVGRVQDAIGAFERYLAQPSRRATEVELTDLRHLVSELRRALATLQIHVSPSSALSTIDGRPVGDGSAPLLLDPGRHRLEFSADGYGPQLRELVLLPGRAAQLEVTLTRQIGTGRLIVHPSVSGARVMINGRVVGRGNLEQSLPEGRHLVVLEAPGYAREERYVLIERGASATVEVALHVQSGRPAWVVPVAIAASVLAAGAIAVGVGVGVSRQGQQPFVYSGRPGTGQWLGNTIE